MINKKATQYERIARQIESLINPVRDTISCMATINAILYHKMKDFSWVGFYLLKGNVLSVGPYQGPLACLELERYKGVCWTCIQQKKTVIVPDVHEFPGHIACDPRSQSEIVVPVFNNKGVISVVLDIDSRNKNWFTDTDAEYLEKIVSMIFRPS